MAETTEAVQQWALHPFADIHFSPTSASTSIPSQHVPRAWERIPKPSHATRHKGRTVWKRAAAAASNALSAGNATSTGTETTNQILNEGERLALGDISTNTPQRGVKKQRLQAGNSSGKDRGQGAGEEAKRFKVTVRDLEGETPKRKQRHVRKSGGVQNLNKRRSLAVPKRRQSQKPGALLTEAMQPAQAVQAEPLPLAIGPTVDQPDTDMATEVKADEMPQPIPQDTATDTPMVVDTGASVVELEAPRSPVKVQSPTKSLQSAAMSVSPRKRGRPRKSTATPVPLKFTGTLTPSATDVQAPALPQEQGNDGNLPCRPADSATLAMTPSNGRLLLDGLPIPTPRLIDLNSPQIGTTLLRRESMRRKSSPGKRLSSRGKSPRKKQLKKRDTLQERDILQKFSEQEASQDGSQNQPLSIAKAEEALTPRSSDLVAEIVVKPVEIKLQEGAPAEELAKDLLENKDLQRAVEAIEVCQDAESSESGGSMSPKSAEEERLAEANEAIAKAELDEAREIIAEACDKAEIPPRKTRSAIRFSDDASMLKDFLSRAQANKAAKTTVLSPKVPKSLQVSPKRSPRKRLASSATTKSAKTKASKLKASPNKAKLEATFGDDLEEEGPTEAQPEEEPETESAACRRSTRARLPTPKTPPTGPSLIPVRRADGTDPVVLQKTQAQELAIVTRANTRRNKGQAKPPQMALRDLSSEDSEDTVTLGKPVIKRGAGKGKAVAWAETLAHYQGAKEVPDVEKKPTVRRMRGLGGVNGTPAAKKKTAPAGPSNGTPAPKRRAKLTG